MKELAKAIWKDSVGSKVIAVGILAIIAYIWAFIQDIPFTQLISQYWNMPVRLGYVISVLSVLYIISLLRKRFKGLTRIQKKIKEFDSLEFTKMNLIASWDVVFISGKPQVNNLVIACALHNVPSILYGGKCTTRNCKNSKYYIDSNIIKQEVYSQLIHEWNILNGKA